LLLLAHKFVGSLALVLNLLTATPAEAREPQLQEYKQDRPVVQRRIPDGARNTSVPFVRTELFFGTAKPEGTVTETEFQFFIDAEITPRFPDGLTVLKGAGQFRSGNGMLIKEDSYVIVLLYPYATAKSSSQKIQRIRELYKDQFDQESVLRADDPYIVWVQF
jgi:hypothetical protein